MGQFERETALEQVGENLFRGELHEGWRIGAVPNGGYVMALAGRALRAMLPHKDPLTVSAFYLTPTTLGAIDCETQLLHSGRSTSFAEVRMSQQGELKVKVTAAYTELKKLHGENWQQAPRPDYPSWDQCERPPQSGIEFRSRVELRLVSGREVFSERQPDGSGEFRGWLRHADGSEPDVLSLLMFADAAPPPIFTVLGPIGWVPTVELTVQVRAHPAPGPLQMRLRTRYLTHGIVEEDGEYWDSNGELVALSRQTAKVRMPRS